MYLPPVASVYEFQFMTPTLPSCPLHIHIHTQRGNRSTVSHSLRRRAQQLIPHGANLATVARIVEMHKAVSVPYSNVCALQYVHGGRRKW